MKRINISYFFIILFLSSLILSLIYIKHNIKNYDKNFLNENGTSFHLMIKNDTQRYFSHGYEIKKQLDENYNYFDTGRDNFTKYLFPRIIALYYKIFDYELYENEKKKSNKFRYTPKFFSFSNFTLLSECVLLVHTNKTQS